jgi:signal transduction histidine kinase
MKRKNRTTAALIVSICLGIFYLGFRSSISATKDTAKNTRILENFKDGKIADSQLTENILMLRTFLLNSYDPVVRNLGKLDAICRVFRESPDFEYARQPPLQLQVTRYCEAVKVKSDMVERYKSEHAIIRNSLKYLPSLADDLERLKIKGDVHSLLADILFETLTPDLGLYRKIKQRLDTLPRAQDRATRMKLASMKQLATAVLERSFIQRELEKKILAGNLSSTLDVMEGAYLSSFEKSQKMDLIYTYILIVACFLLGLWLAWTFRHLNSAQNELRNLNAVLEDKVSLRTKELSSAMNQLADNQQLLMQSMKMTALGEMAGGIAHEINTPLAAISMNASSLLECENIANEAQARKRLEAILKIVERVSKIIMGLRRFSRSEEGSEKVPTSIRQIVDDTMSLCAEKMKSRSIDVAIDLSSEELTILCHSEQISQVLLNLLNNSLDALTASIAPEDRWIKIEVAKKQDSVEISVTDSGNGIAPSTQDRLMQPFFTTKGPGAGTGLGLSISKGIVEQHRGSLRLDRASANTRFVITLPRPSA